MAKAIVPQGKQVGTHVGKVTVKKSGSFDLTVGKVRLQSIRWKHMTAVHRFDEYIYCAISSDVQFLMD